jgi:hypothetical protein
MTKEIKTKTAPAFFPPFSSESLFVPSNGMSNVSVFCNLAILSIELSSSSWGG